MTTTKKNAPIFKAKVEEIFGGDHFVHKYKETLTDFSEKPSDRRNKVSFEYDNNNVTFAKLQKLSDLLGTEEIDFTGEKTDDSYWGIETSGTITAYNVKIPV